ncbi:MAG TPA: hypothetical protein VID73_05340, partial [Ktedonobacterales bacterium]
DPARRPLRWFAGTRAALGPVGAAAGIIALWLAFSPHVFPWYTAALLPFCALCLARSGRPLSSALALGAWTFCAVVPLAYVAFAAPELAWLYPALYVAALAVALGTGAWLGRARLLIVLGAARDVAATPLKGTVR